MIQIVFKHMQKSDLAKEATLDRIESIVDRFPDLEESRIFVTLSMENSPIKPGPDLFRVKVRVEGGRYRGVTMEKAASNLYVALADVVEHLQEKLNRFGDRSRVRARSRARKAVSLFSNRAS